MKYEKFLLSVFDKCIEITNNNNNIDNNSNNIDNGKILQIDINNHNYAAKRRGLSSARHTRLSKKELLLVPSI